MHSTPLNPPIPQPPRLPLVGNLHQLSPNRIINQLETWSRTLGRTFAFHVLNRRVLCFSTLEPLLDAFKRRPETFRRVASIEAITRELGVHGVFSAEGDDWKHQRELMKPAFARRSITRAFGAIPEVTTRLLQQIDNQGLAPIDFRTFAMRYTADVTTKLVFGEDLNSVEHASPVQQQIEHIFAALARRIHIPLPYWRYFKLQADRETESATAYVRDLVLKVIRNRSQADHGGPPTLLDTMIDARSNDKNFSEDDLFGNVFTLLLAGEDTTANGIAWMSIFLAQRPDLQRALREEATAALGDRPCATSLDELNALPKAQAVFKETLRLKGAAPMIFFDANEPTTIGGHHIQTGQTIVALTRILALDPEHFTEPGAFLPDRWDPAFVAARPGWRHNLQAYLPFGAGPRTCIGAQLAIIEAQTLVSALCKRYEISLITNPHAIQERGGFVLFPSPFTLQFTPIAST